MLAIAICVTSLLLYIHRIDCSACSKCPVRKAISQYGDSGTINISKKDKIENMLKIMAIVRHAKYMPKTYVNRIPNDTNTLLKFNSMGLNLGWATSLTYINDTDVRPETQFMNRLTAITSPCN